LSGQFLQQSLFAAFDAILGAIVTSHTHRNAMIQPKSGKLLEKRGSWGTVDTFLHFQPLLLYCKSKQAQNLSHNKGTLYTQYHAKTWKQGHSEKNLQSICKRYLFL